MPCAQGFFSGEAATKCTQHKNCDALGKVQVTAGDSESDAVCGDLKQCLCPNGTGAEGKKCRTNDAIQCTACAGAFYLDGEKCVKKLCRCPNGTRAEGKKCRTNNASQCTACAGAFYLVGEKCMAHTNCDALGRVTKTQGSNTANAVCGITKLQAAAEKKAREVAAAAKKAKELAEKKAKEAKAAAEKKALEVAAAAKKAKEAAAKKVAEKAAPVKKAANKLKNSVKNVFGGKKKKKKGKK